MKLNKMKRVLFSRMLIVAATFGLMITATNLNAATIFESSTLGPTGITWQQALDGEVVAASVKSTVFTGVRFELTQSVIISEIGGHFFSPGSGSFFGTIISLENGEDFPDSGDFLTTDVLGSTTLTFPVDSAEVFGDLALPLGPGWYALIYGSGFFETDGNGGMVSNNSDIGPPEYIAFQPGFGWSNLEGFLSDFRFVVKGNVVPEPTAIVIVATSSLCLLFRRRQ